MNKTIMAACLGTMAASSLVFADENSVFSETQEPTVQDVSIGNPSPLLGSLSLRAGYFGMKGDDEIIDDGVGAQVELKFALADSPFDLVLRGHGASAESDDDEVLVAADTYSYGRGRVAEVVAIGNIEETVYGGSVQLQYNFMRNKQVNPYIAIGAMYERSDMEYDAAYVAAYRPSYYSSSYYWNGVEWHDKIHEDGFAAVGRIGIEFNSDLIYARAEAAMFSEIYDDDGTQAELNAIGGVKIMDSLRLELSGTYFTEWKEYYILGGVTFLF